MQEAFKNNQQKQKRYFDRGSRELPSLEEDGEVGLNYKRGGLNYKPGGFQRSSRRTLNHVKYIFNIKKKGEINDDDDVDDYRAWEVRCIFHLLVCSRYFTK